MTTSSSRPSVRSTRAAEAAASADSGGDSNRHFLVGLLSGAGGAIVFSFPILMTMEMWSLGFHIHPFRLALLILLDVPLLFALSYYAGFEGTVTRLADALDALSAFAVGFVTSAVLLYLFAILGPGMSADEIIGKIAIQAVPASIGAMLSRSQLGEGQPQEEEKRRNARYSAGLFLMAVGALYLSSSVAPTEEMVLISYLMSPWHVLALLAFSLVLLHAFLQLVVTEGNVPRTAGGVSFRALFLRHTVVGYAVALVISGFTLWIFGRTDGLEPGQVLQVAVVLGFPAALGAGVGRLIM